MSWKKTDCEKDVKTARDMKSVCFKTPLNKSCCNDMSTDTYILQKVKKLSINNSCSIITK